MLSYPVENFGKNKILVNNENLVIRGNLGWTLTNLKFGFKNCFGLNITGLLISFGYGKGKVLTGESEKY